MLNSEQSTVLHSVIGSLPPERVGVGSATNGTALQTGVAVGVAVIDSSLATRHQGHTSGLLAGQSVPASVAHIITGTLGGALGVAGQVGGPRGAALVEAARSAFSDGMRLALSVGAVEVAVGAVLVVAALPAHERG